MLRRGVWWVRSARGGHESLGKESGKREGKKRRGKKKGREMENGAAVVAIDKAWNFFVSGQT